MEICGFEIAKKLKEKGFDKYCSRAYSEIGCFNDTDTYKSSGEFYCYAPTISQVLKWLREKDIMVEIPIDLRDDGIWRFTFRIQTKEFYERAIKEDYSSYEEAVMACLEYIINNLI